MKKNKLIILLALFIITTAISCKRYLDLPPKNQRTVTSVNDVKSLLGSYLKGVGEIRQQTLFKKLMPMQTNASNMMFEAYSDNINFDVALTGSYLKPNNIHMPQEKNYADLLLWNDMTTPGNIWVGHYEIIGFLNALIDQLKEEVKDATPAQQDQLLGEMYAHRAYYFFKLLQYFGPYENGALGIPVYLHSGKEVLGVDVSRKSHAEVYKAILEDLTAAEQMLNRTLPQTGYNILFNSRFLHHLMAQVYWFKAESPAKEATDYEQVKTHASIAIDGVASAIPATATDIMQAFAGKSPSYPVIYQENNLQGGCSPIYGSCYQYIGFSPTDIQLNDDFCALFTPGDIRATLYFNQNPARAGGRVGAAGKILNWGWPTDGSADGTTKWGSSCLFKPEEAYLMLAEAQFKTNQPNDAITTLNAFKGFRNAGTANGLAGDALLQEIRNERRKEFFCDTDKRWLDLKRYGGKTINRKLIFFQKTYNLKAEPNDYHYALPIPLVEIQQNKGIIPNEGWITIEY